MFKLTEILLSMRNLIFKYSALILCVGCILLGVWVFCSRQIFQKMQELYCLLLHFIWSVNSTERKK